ncbi:MAG: VWA domain-containing protein, partial [Betaproteobacteria bacterium]|nr:VWA domain-containing protein [Betaproteobacteria bacterium]
TQGQLADNIVHFARVLRSAGLPLASDRVVLATEAVLAVGLQSIDDLRYSLCCTLTTSADQQSLFDQAFTAFWRDPDLLGKAMQMLLPKVDGGLAPAHEANRRLAQALSAPAKPRGAENNDEQDQQSIEARMSFSSRELLQKADFETLSSAEWVAVSRLVSQLVPHMPLVLSRRKKAALHHGPIDMRRVARSALRSGGEIMQLPRKMPRKQAMRVLALLDISGSMTSYSRMFLYFLHSLTRVDPRTKTLVFGTRLTDLSAAMRENDPDASIAKAVSLVDDWNGGTRIALNLERFNKDIAQRMAGSRTMILLVTDGLERDDAKALGREAARLSRRCKHLIWLNPLLRFQGFEPKASGVRALLPHVSAHLPVHNLQSLMALAHCA